jgi:hypothetical protein
MKKKTPKAIARHATPALTPIPAFAPVDRPLDDADLVTAACSLLDDIGGVDVKSAEEEDEDKRIDVREVDKAPVRESRVDCDAEDANVPSPVTDAAANHLTTASSVLSHMMGIPFAIT